MLDPQYILHVGLIVAFAAFVQGFTGLGFGIVAIAGIAFTPWDLERASVVINLLLVILNCTIIYAGRKDSKINWKMIAVILGGEIFGVPAGYWFIYTCGNRPIFRLALGIVLVLFAVHAIIRPRIRKSLHMAWGALAGVVGGFFAGAFTAAGPPLALFVYSRFKNPADAKVSLQIIFLTATLWRLFTIVFFGDGISVEVFRISAMSFPVVALFAALGHIFTKRLSSETFLKIVYLFIGFAGVLNIFRGLR